MNLAHISQCHVKYRGSVANPFEGRKRCGSRPSTLVDVVGCRCVRSNPRRVANVMQMGTWE